MSDSTTAAPATRSHPTRSGQLQVHLRVQKLSNLTQISTWSSNIGALSSAVHRALERVHRGAHAASAHVGRAQPIERGAVSEHPGRQFLHRSIGRR